MKTILTHALAATLVASAALFSTGCSKETKKPADERPVLRVGFFPNITHAPALIGYEETSSFGDKGWFESRTGARIEWYAFNAGPSAMESLMLNSIDVTYVGPNPTLNSHTRTKGKDIRVISGVTRGGAALIVPEGSPLKTPADFKGRKIATPQLGNTQDVAARAWLKAGGLAITQAGGDASVLPTANPDQLDLFKRGQVDAVWTVEPWVSRLKIEAKGVALVQQDDVPTTILTTSVRTRTEKAELLAKFAAAHKELSDKMNADKEWAKTTCKLGLKRAVGRPLPDNVVDLAWEHLTFSTDISTTDFTKVQADAKGVGLLPEEIPLDKLVIAKP